MNVSQKQSVNKEHADQEKVKQVTADFWNVYLKAKYGMDFSLDVADVNSMTCFAQQATRVL